MKRQTFTNSRDRFKTLAENRTNKILSAINVLSHCSNRAIYEFTDDEVERIFRVIDEAINEARIKFKKKEKIRFKL
jgi:hypothetical protein